MSAGIRVRASRGFRRRPPIPNLQDVDEDPITKRWLERVYNLLRLEEQRRARVVLLWFRYEHEPLTRD
jgi:hypothetical protein